MNTSIDLKLISILRKLNLERFDNIELLFSYQSEVKELKELFESSFNNIDYTSTFFEKNTKQVFRFIFNYLYPENKYVYDKTCYSIEIEEVDTIQNNKYWNTVFETAISNKSKDKEKLLDTLKLSFSKQSEYTDFENFLSHSNKLFGINTPAYRDTIPQFLCNILNWDIENRRSSYYYISKKVALHALNLYDSIINNNMTTHGYKTYTR